MVVMCFIAVGCSDYSRGKETAVDMKTCPAVGEKGTSGGATCPVQGAGKGMSAGAMSLVHGAGTNLPAGEVCPVQGKGIVAGQGIIMEGTVIQTIPAGRYIYLEMETKSGPVWLAAMATAQPVAKGDKISCPQGMVMEKFKSPTLKRTFDKVCFVESLTVSKNSSATNDVPR